jgi:hypothetical protein
MANYLDGIDGGKHNSDNSEVRIKTFTVSVTFTDLVANNPLDAAKKACEWLLDDKGASRMVYDVHNEQTGEIFTVDLELNDSDAVTPTMPF